MYLSGWIDISRPCIHKDTVALNETLDQMDLIDVHRTFHLNVAECTLLSRENGTFLMIDHMFGHKTILNKFKNMETISSIFSYHNGIELDFWPPEQ